MFAGGPIEHKEKPVAASLRYELARGAAKFRVKYYGSFDRIPVVDVVG